MIIKNGWKRLWNYRAYPYQGNYKELNVDSQSDEPMDEYTVVALAKRLNITIDDMKQMSFVSLVNILISSVEEKSDKRKATQEDIDNMF